MVKSYASIRFGRDGQIQYDGKPTWLRLLNRDMMLELIRTTDTPFAAISGYSTYALPATPSHRCGRKITTENLPNSEHLTPNAVFPDFRFPFSPAAGFSPNSNQKSMSGVSVLKGA